MTKALRTYTIDSSTDNSRVTMRLTRKLHASEGLLAWTCGDLVWGDPAHICRAGATVADAMADAEMIWPVNSAWHGAAGTK